MKKILIIVLASILLTFSNVNAGTDGENSLSKKNSGETKDCFEKVNRGIFAFNQGLDKAIFEPLAKGYRKLPVPIKLGTSNILENLSTCMCANLKEIPGHPFYILFQGYEAGIKLKVLRKKAKKAGYKYQPSITLEQWLQGLVDNKTLTSQERDDWLRLNDVVLESLKVDDFENEET